MYTNESLCSNTEIIDKLSNNYLVKKDIILLVIHELQ
jgi:hypothetical protein